MSYDDILTKLDYEKPKKEEEEQYLSPVHAPRKPQNDLQEDNRTTVNKLVDLVNAQNEKMSSIENRYKKFRNEMVDIKSELKKIRGH